MMTQKRKQKIFERTVKAIFAWSIALGYNWYWGPEYAMYFLLGWIAASVSLDD